MISDMTVFVIITLALVGLVLWKVHTMTDHDPEDVGSADWFARLRASLVPERQVGSEPLVGEETRCTAARHGFPHHEHFVMLDGERHLCKGVQTP
jgi:hypothetical protein